MNNCSLKYNIGINIRLLKQFLAYFDMNEKNTLIELVTYKKVNKELENFNDKVVFKDKDRIIFKNMKFEQLTYIMSKNPVFNIYFYKVSKNYKVEQLNHKLINNNIDSSIHVKLDKIYEICFNKEKYDETKTKEYFKKYRKFISPEYIVLLILLVIGIIITIIRK